jgi:C_GCAxxG_C_C family probable redox protein
MDSPGAELSGLIRNRAKHLVRSHHLHCSEAVFTVLNQVLGGGLPAALATNLASGFPEGLGGSGCLCGALSGGVLALGLFLGQAGSKTLPAKSVKRATRTLHDLFREQFGSTCCRVLTKSLPPRSAKLIEHCGEITGATAEIAARLILQQRPELLAQADVSALSFPKKKLLTRLQQIVKVFRLPG